MEKPHILYPILLGLGLSISTSLQAERVYKWTDEKGQTNYTQHRPNGASGNGPIEVINPKAAKHDPNRALEELRTREQAFQERRKQQQEGSVKQAAATQTQTALDSKCREVRATLTSLETQPRTLYTDANGQVQRMDEATRQGRMTEYRGFLQENCN